LSYRFTIVMTVYQRVELLLRAFYSVLFQDEKSWELIIVADGPQPEAERMIYEFLRYHPEHQDRISYMTVVRLEDCWGNRARRQGLLRARGEYTCFIGHDCLLSSSYLTKHRTNLDRSAVPVLSVVGVEYWRGKERGNGKTDYWGLMPWDVRLPEEWGTGDIDLTCMAFPTKYAVQQNVFAGDSEASYFADVEGFMACRKELSVVYDLAPVAAHF
jgi:hypothetical protein